MYQYSLDWFIEIFNTAINQSSKSSTQNERIRHINDFFNVEIYNRICRSVYEKHKLLFSFLFSINLMKADNEISDSEWLFFLTGGVFSEVVSTNPHSDWLADKTWNELLKYKEVCRIAFIEDIQAHSDQWTRFVEDPDKYLLPNEKKFNKFQKLNFLKIFRGDKLYSGVQKFVKENLDSRFVEAPVFNLNASYLESNQSTPLIFILSQGEDPLKHFYRLAKDYNMNHKIYSVSLGQVSEWEEFIFH